MEANVDYDNECIPKQTTITTSSETVPYVTIIGPWADVSDDE